MRAYSIGIFPMASRRSDPSVHWVAPTMRGILPLATFHMPRRLRRTLAEGSFEVRCDTAFAAVIDACAEPRDGHPETWINAQIARVFCELHVRGHAHSVEAWRDGQLVGGLYGLALGGAFFGESMFSRQTDASKIALVHLVARLRLGGFVLLDIQFVTDASAAVRRDRDAGGELSAATRRGAAAAGLLLRGSAVGSACRRVGHAGHAIEHPQVVDRVLQGRQPRARSEHPSLKNARSAPVPGASRRSPGMPPTPAAPPAGACRKRRR